MTILRRNTNTKIQMFSAYRKLLPSIYFLGLSNDVGRPRQPIIGWPKTAHSHRSSTYPKSENSAVGRSHVGAGFSVRKINSNDTGPSGERQDDHRCVASVIRTK